MIPAIRHPLRPPLDRAIAIAIVACVAISATLTAACALAAGPVAVQTTVNARAADQSHAHHACQSVADSPVAHGRSTDIRKRADSSSCRPRQAHGNEGVRDLHSDTTGGTAPDGHHGQTRTTPTRRLHASTTAGTAPDGHHHEQTRSTTSTSGLHSSTTTGTAADGRHHAQTRSTTATPAQSAPAPSTPAQSTASIAAVLATPCQNTELTPAPDNLAEVEAATLCLINQERARHSEQPLQLNAQLQQAAQSHSEEMISDDYFGHVSPSGETPLQRILQTGYVPSPEDGYTIGENIAWGTLQLSTPAAIVAAWIASPEHLANILYAPYSDTGLAVVPEAPPSLAEGEPGALYSQEFGEIITA